MMLPGPFERSEILVGTEIVDKLGDITPISMKVDRLHQLLESRSHNSMFMKSVVLVAMYLLQERRGSLAALPGGEEYLVSGSEAVPPAPRVPARVTIFMSLD